MYPVVFGKYVLERELAHGGMARVLLATLRGAGGFEKRLVVKQIRDELSYDQEFVRRFVEEAKTTVALSHPNIVPVYELGVEQGTYFLAMELVDGVSVAELLRPREGTRAVLSPEEGAYLGMEVCRALDYAHRRMKVVHRDITPRNVMVDEEGQVKLIDFGIAAPARVAGHEIFGSPGHMPPEQIEGGALGPEADIFAVGVLLLEAWSGSAPFRRKTPEASEAAMRAEPHPRASDADPKLRLLDDVIAKTLRLDPSERQQAASELGRALRAFLSTVDVGDIARGLGDKVRAIREEAEAAASLPREAAVSAPKNPSLAEIGTVTFAARGVAEDVPSTRKLDDDGDAPPPKSVETIATRPLETPVRGSARRSSERTTSGPRLRARLVAGGGIAAALALVWALAQRSPQRVPAGAGPPAASPSAVVTPPVETTASTAPEPGVPAAPPRAPSAATVRASAAPVPVQAASSESRATVTLLGDPGTRVTVDGTPRGACPVKIALDPGSHDVRFVFDPTGESRGERLSVKAGDRVTIRGDFTGASPTVRVSR